MIARHLDKKSRPARSGSQDAGLGRAREQARSAARRGAAIIPPPPGLMAGDCVGDVTNIDQCSTASLLTRHYGLAA